MNSRILVGTFDAWRCIVCKPMTIKTIDAFIYPILKAKLLHSVIKKLKKLWAYNDLKKKEIYHQTYAHVNASRECIIKWSRQNCNIVVTLACWRFFCTDRLLIFHAMCWYILGTWNLFSWLNGRGNMVGWLVAIDSQFPLLSLLFFKTRWRGFN